MSQNLIKYCIEAIDRYAQKNNLEIRFVGGVSYGGLLNKGTTYDIDIRQKKIKLNHHNELIDIRDDGTIKDIDIIIICPHKEEVKKLRTYINNLQSEIKQKYNLNIPISLESAYYPDFGKRTTLLQFVTTMRVDKDISYGHGTISLEFEDVSQEIPWNSLESWKVILEDGLSYTTRNPIADYYAYHTRLPQGIKPKDKEKVQLLEKLNNQLIKEGKKQDPSINYEDASYFYNWQLYKDKLYNTSNVRIKLKRRLVKLYWHTIGTYIAHGKGIGRYFLSASDKFTGINN